MRDLSLVRSIAQEHFHRTQPVDWFDVLYREAGGNSDLIPWAATLQPNPNLVSWLERERFALEGRKALVAGCGLGQDAEELARRGAQVTAFDVSPKAIEWAKQRTGQSNTDYRCVDLFTPPEDFLSAFDFVLEAYTVQSLPPEYHERAAKQIAGFVAPGGGLLVICRARDEGSDEGNMPWPLAESELAAFASSGLTLATLEDFVDESEGEPTRRFRALFQRNLG